MTPKRENTADLMDRALAPVFQKLADFIPDSVSPNQVTLVSGCSGLAAGFVLMLWHSPMAYWLVSFLLIVYSFLDNMDGIHARRTGQTSNIGGFYDHALDAAITPLIYLALVFRLDLGHPLFLSVVYLRSLANSLAFSSEVATRKLFIPALGPTVESYVTIAVLLLIYFFPEGAGPGPAVLGHLNLGWLGFTGANGSLALTSVSIFFLISFFGNLMGFSDIVRFTVRNK